MSSGKRGALDKGGHAFLWPAGCRLENERGLQVRSGSRAPAGPPGAATLMVMLVARARFDLVAGSHLARRAAGRPGYSSAARPLCRRGARGEHPGRQLAVAGRRRRPCRRRASRAR